MGEKHEYIPRTFTVSEIAIINTGKLNLEQRNFLLGLRGKTFTMKDLQTYAKSMDCAVGDSGERHQLQAPNLFSNYVYKIKDEHGKPIDPRNYSEQEYKIIFGLQQ